MKCSFTLSKDDYKALMKVVSKRLVALSGANTKLFFVNLLVWFVIGIAFSMHISMLRKYPGITHDILFVAGFSLAALAAIIIGSAYRNQIVRRVAHSGDSWFYQTQAAEFDATGLTASGSYGETRYVWSAFKHVEEDTANLYLFLDNSQAYVLPKKALADCGADQDVRAWLASHAILA
ncbi:YcxB family protein [Niveibacterium sp. COAC-50]|uniref:YcxB family protein n=1 Tax=Niveibacterium sp. COAC-50 TaxID=2729384 RepID=UPI001557AAE3|nr:YcxB family protein [Niveibacterium sp. COAC-50]